jgi:putative aminopeptidase FrvX
MESDSSLNQLNQSFLELLAALVRAPSVVGSEDPFFRVLRRELELHRARVNHYQGLMVACGDQPESLIVSAHIDRHGIVCTGPNEFQFAAFVTKNQGELDGNSVSEQTVHAIVARFRGARVEAYDPWNGGYLGQGEIRSAFYCDHRRNIVFDIPDLVGLRPGTPVAYLEHLAVRDDSLSAQLDNVLMVALVVDMFRRGFQGTALFTAEEEAGRSWRYILGWFNRFHPTTQRLLVLDTSPYPDKDTADMQEVVLRKRDAHGTFSPALVSLLEDVCQRAGASYGYKDAYIDAENEKRQRQGLLPRSVGRTELGRVVSATQGGINGATLQIPTTGYHTNRETASLAAVRAALAVTDLLIEA